MGVPPLPLQPGEWLDSLDLTGEEVYSITDLEGSDEALSEVTVHAEGTDGSKGVHGVRQDRHPNGSCVLPPRRDPAVHPCVS